MNPTPLPRLASRPEFLPLRQAAEALAANLPAQAADELALPALVHELRVHQIELEMQNDDLRRAQLALETTRDRYIDLYDQAPVGYFSLDAAGLITEANLTGAALLGIERGRLIGRRFAGQVDPSETDRWHQFALRRHRHGNAGRIELALRTRDGRALQGQLDAVPAKTAEGQATLRLTLSDITLRHQTEESLAESEASQRALLEGLADGMFVAQDQRFVLTNPALPAMIGCSADELLGKTFDTVVAPPCLDLWQKRMAACLGDAAAPVVNDELQILCRGAATPLWVELRASPFRHRGRPAVLGLLRDISERKRSQSLLDDELRRHRVLTEASRDGIVVLDAVGDVCEANAAFAELIGRSVTALPLLNVRDWDQGWPAETLLQVLLRGDVARSQPLQRVFLRPDGSQRRVALSARSTSIQGRRLIFCICRDVTDALRNAEELDRYRRHLMTRVEERTRQLGRAESEPQRVIDDIRDQPGIDVDEVAREYIDFSLQDLLANCCALVGTAAEAKGLALSVEIDGVPDALRGDPLRLSQVLINLLSNAVKFTERGRIDVLAEWQPRGADGLQLVLRVRDTGIGITPERLPSLLSPFAQADPGSRRFGGTGLGLAIAHRLARLMGGDLTVSSQPGVGSEFSLHLRLKSGTPRPQPAAAAPTDAEAALQRQCAGARVLLVDDNAINRAVARGMLEAVDLQVDEADDGLAALEQAVHHDYSLILMDVQMPAMDGLEATRRLRALPRSATTPIVALTASAFAEDRAACLAAGMNDHLAKPVVSETLYAALLRWLTAHPAQPDNAAAQPAALGKAEAAPATPGDATASGGGLNLALAIRQLGGRRALAWRALQSFLRHYRETLPALRQAVAEGKPAELARQAHALRGAAAAVGATHLPSMTLALEDAVAHQCPAAEVTAAWQGVLDELASVLDEIASVLTNNPPPAADPAP